MHSRKFGVAAGYLGAIVVIGVTVVPLLFVVFGGFRTNAQINSDPAGLPGPWVTDNYASVLSSSAFWKFLGNSALIAVIATVVAVGLGSMAGYALSRYQFKGREGVYTLFTLGLLFPLTVATLPLYLWLRQLGMLESFWGVAIPEAAFSLPVTIVILRPFMHAIPGEIEDAAVLVSSLDGRTRPRSVRPNARDGAAGAASGRSGGLVHGGRETGRIRCAGGTVLGSTLAALACSGETAMRYAWDRLMLSARFEIRPRAP
jgi:raffinose/stachyose/melibiose transport system permease protein